MKKTNHRPEEGEAHPKKPPKRLSLHPLVPQDALRHALGAGKVTKPKGKAKK
jgi:hypothetical protein